MRSRTSAVVTSIALVSAVTIGVFASASFATQGLVSQTDELPDDGPRLIELRTRGDVKEVVRNDVRGYKLSFTTTFTPPEGADLGGSEQGSPDLVMRQSISYPTLSENKEYVGPVELPFASQTLALTVRMNGACFEPSGKSSVYRLDGFDPKCVEAALSLGDESFDVTALFIDVDSSLRPIGRDAKAWVWRSNATFQDPGYGFPIVSLGQGGSTTVMIGDMVGVARTGQVKFGGGG